MRFVGLIKTIGVRPSKDAAEIEIKIVTAMRRGVPDQLARMLMSDVTIDISESQLPLPGADETAEGDAR